MEAIDWKDPDDFSRVGRREQADVQILVNSLHNQLFLKCVEWCIFQQCMSLTEVSRLKRLLLIVILGSKGPFGEEV